MLAQRELVTLAVSVVAVPIEKNAATVPPLRVGVTEGAVTVEDDAPAAPAAWSIPFDEDESTPVYAAAPPAAFAEEESVTV